MRCAMVLATLAVAVGCSSTGSVSETGAMRSMRGSANLITEQEIAAGSYSTALDVIENLRPAMLRPRASSLTSTAVAGTSQNMAASVNVICYVDEVRLGETSNLRSIPAQQIREVRYINARDATTRWGTGHGSGVVQVITKK